MIGLPIVLVIAWYNGDRGDWQESGDEPTCGRDNGRDTSDDDFSL